MKRWSFLAVPIGLVLFLQWVGCANPMLAGGKLHFDQKRFGQARNTFQEACVQMPQSGDARMWLGRAYAELDRPDSASMNFDLAVQLDPKLAAYMSDVRAHYWSDRFNSGIASAKEGDKTKAQGDATASAKQYRAALKDFYKAGIYDPSRNETFMNLGKVYFNLGEVDSAITMFQKVRSMAPNDAKVNDLLFSVYRKQGDEAYTEAGIKLAGSDSTGAKKYFQGAAEFYSQADQIKQGDPDLNFQLGATYYELAQLIPGQKKDFLDKSAGKYREVLKVNDKDLDVMYNLVLALRDQQKYTEAKEIAGRLVDLKPNDGVYHEILGRIEDKLGNKQALVSELVFGRALKSGTKIDGGEGRARAQKYGASSDLQRRYVENGAPEEIFTFQDTQGSEYEVWFYWSRGQGFAFVNGQEKYTARFAKFVPGQAPGEAQPGGGQN